MPVKGLPLLFQKNNFTLNHEYKQEAVAFSASKQHNKRDFNPPLYLNLNSVLVCTLVQKAKCSEFGSQFKLKLFS